MRVCVRLDDEKRVRQLFSTHRGRLTLPLITNTFIEEVREHERATDPTLESRMAQVPSASYKPCIEGGSGIRQDPTWRLLENPLRSQYET